MALNERAEELLNRGLDADLDRHEMRELYRLAARNPEVPKNMGELAEVEEALAELARATAEARPKAGIAAQVFSKISASSTPVPKPGVIGHFWDWLRSPHGLRFQPLSFGFGLAAAVLLLAAGLPTIGSRVIAPERLHVTSVPFAQAQARLDWTYQFIAEPGQATRVALDLGDEKPVTLRFEAFVPTDVKVVHKAPQSWRSREHSFKVDGIGFASLENPRAGDEVVVINQGKVPVVVYAYTNGYGGSQVTTASRAL